MNWQIDNVIDKNNLLSLLFKSFLIKLLGIRLIDCLESCKIMGKKAIDIDKIILKSKKTLQLTSIHAIIFSSGQVYPPNRLSIRAARTPPQS